MKKNVFFYVVVALVVVTTFFVFRDNLESFFFGRIDSIKNVPPLSNHREEGDRIENSYKIKHNFGRPSETGKDKNTRRIKVDKTSELRGWKVVTWKGEPLEGAKIFISLASRKLIKKWLDILDDGKKPAPVFLQGVSEEDGTFEIPGIKSELYFVHVEKQGYSSGYGILDLTKSWPKDFIITLDPVKRINGEVLDSKGKGVGAVEITSHECFFGDIMQIPLDKACEITLFSACTHSDSEGSFTIEDRSVFKDYWIDFEHENYISLSKIVNFYDKRKLRIILKTPCVLEGRVFDKKRKPVKDACVYYRFSQERPSYSNQIKTDSEGRYRFDDAPEGMIHLIAFCNGFGNSCCKIRLNPLIVNKKDLTLPDGISLKITVKGEDNNPIRDINVSVKDVSTSTNFGMKKPDEKGDVIFSGLNKGDVVYVKLIDHSGLYPYRREFVKLYESKNVTYILKQKTERKLFVYDEDSKKPIPRFKLCFLSYFSNTKSRESEVLEKYDRQEIDCLSKDGGISLLSSNGEIGDSIIIASGYEPFHLVVNEDNFLNNPNKIIKVYLKKAPFLSGIVIDGINKNPVEDAEVRICVPGRLTKLPVHGLKAASVKTGEDGMFSLNCGEDERFYLEVSALGYARKFVDILGFSDNNDISKNIIELFPYGEIKGFVRGQNGDPIECAKVKAYFPGTQYCLYANTNINGEYSIIGLPEGRLKVCAMDTMTNYAMQTFSVEKVKYVDLSVGECAQVDFNFGGTSAIFGWCTVGGKDPEYGVKISLFDEDGKLILCSNSSLSGYYRFDNVPSGKIMLKAHSEIEGIGGMFIMELNLSEKETKEIDIDISGLSIVGTVAAKDGEPIESAVLKLIKDSSEENLEALTNFNGEYEFLNVSDGNYFLLVKADSYAEKIKGPIAIGDNNKAVRVDFSMSPGGVICIALRDEKNKAISGGEVFLLGDLPLSYRQSGTSGSSGCCVFDCLGPEKRTVIAGAEGFAPGGAQFNAVPGERTDCDIVLVQGGTLRVVVQAKDGTPLPGATVSLPDFSVFGLDAFRLAGLGLLETSDGGFRTDGKGEFSIGPLTPGPVTVRVQRGTLFASTEAEISAGKENAVRVILK